MADQMVEMYSRGIGIKTIAKELLGRESAKSTVRSLLLRRGVELRDIATTQDEETKARRYAWRSKAAAIRKEIKRRARGRKLGSAKGLELFEIGRKRQAKERRLQKAKEQGFSSPYHHKYQTNQSFRAKEVLKRRLNKFVKAGSGRRMSALIGCSWDKFKSYIESQWEPWMNWDNLGGPFEGNWQIDHIVPCSWFDQENPEHRALCWHHSNLRPICARMNLARNNKPKDILNSIERIPDKQRAVQLLEFVLALDSEGVRVLGKAKI